jgi:hypothetical protein
LKALTLGQAVALASSHVDGTNMIRYDVKHDEHVPRVTRLNQSLKISLAAELWVQAVQILHPIPVIPVCSLGNDGRNPNCVKPHT